MRFHQTPRPLLHLITTILLAPRPSIAGPHPDPSVLAGFSFNELFARYDCDGTACGWHNKYCCTGGTVCTTSGDIAECVATASGGAGGGYWSVYTTTYQETIVSTVSTYVASASASGSARCNYAINETPCGDVCCPGDQYCAKLGHCKPADLGQTTTTATSASNGALPPVLGTSTSLSLVTATKTPTHTVPFETPVATGANVTMIESAHHSGLSGGAIAGIVIGVLVGLFILGLICFYCCIKGLIDGCLAIFGLGRRRRTTEVEEYERRTHHSSGGGVRRTWWGGTRPGRVEEREKRDSHFARDALGIGAGLAGLWAILGLKRRNNQKKRNYAESYYSSDYYTSESSASSGGRTGTRYSRYSERDRVRSVSRR